MSPITEQTIRMVVGCLDARDWTRRPRHRFLHEGTGRWKIVVETSFAFVFMMMGGMVSGDDRR